MSAKTLRGRLQGGHPLYLSWSMLPGPLGAEVLALQPWDAAVIDMQHGLIGFPEARDMAITVMHTGKPAVVRVPLAAPGLTGKMLDVGAEGVIAPMINTAEDARALVAATKYPPLGERSWGAYRALGAGGHAAEDYLARANDLVVTFAMIETRTALDNLAAIASTPGLDGLFVGPHDLTISLTGGATLRAAETAESRDAIALIAATARDNGLVAGIYCATPEDALARAEAGYGFLAVGSDRGFLAAGATAALQSLQRA